MEKMKPCKACGEQIAKSAKTCPKCGAKQGGKVLPIVIAVIVVLIVIAAIGGTSDEPQKVGEVDTNSPAPIETQEEPEESVFGVGDVVVLDDVNVTLLSVTENSGANYVSPSDGNVFVLFELDIDNQSDSEIAVSSLLSFTAYFDDYSQQLSLSSLITSDLPQLDGSVDAGRKMTGVVGYEVPEDWQTAEIRFTPDFWAGQEIIFESTK